jgi:hypothetical protein
MILHERICHRNADRIAFAHPKPLNLTGPSASAQQIIPANSLFLIPFGTAVDGTVNEAPSSLWDSSCHQARAVAGHDMPSKSTRILLGQAESGHYPECHPAHGRDSDSIHWMTLHPRVGHVTGKRTNKGFMSLAY